MTSNNAQLCLCDHLKSTSRLGIVHSTAKLCHDENQKQEVRHETEMREPDEEKDVDCESRYRARRSAVDGIPGLHDL